MATATQNTALRLMGRSGACRSSAVRGRRATSAVTAAEHVSSTRRMAGPPPTARCTDVFSRADVWREATAAYSPGHPVVVKRRLTAEHPTLHRVRFDAAPPQKLGGAFLPAPTLGRRGVDRHAVCAERKPQEPSMSLLGRVSSPPSDHTAAGPRRLRRCGVQARLAPTIRDLPT